MSEPDPLADAFRHLLEVLRGAADAVDEAPAAATPIGRARGYEHLARQLLKGLEEHMLRDPDHPRSRVLDDRIRTGGDNPDQRYLFAPIEGGAQYRLWGTKGSASRVEVQLYSREPYGGEDVGVGYLPDEAIDFGPDGSFSIDLAPGVDGPSALANPTEASIVNVRQIYSDWTSHPRGDVFLDRVGAEGSRKLAEGPEAVADRLRRAADDIAASVRCWPELVDNGVVGFFPPNELSPLLSPGAQAGVVGRWISVGHYLLAPGEALVIDIPPTGAPYRGAQLSDLWFASLEYASATSSLSEEQTVRAPDGHEYLVVSLDDPGYANWLDPTGVDRGVVHLRYDGLDEAPGPEAAPTATLTTIGALAGAIPGFDDAVLVPAQRAAQRAERRRHVQVRYGR